MTLFEIDQEIMNCVKLTGSEDYVNVETGEIIDVEALKSLEMERDKKLRNIGCWVLNLQAEEAALAEQIKKFMARKAAAHNKAESLKQMISAVRCLRSLMAILRTCRKSFCGLKRRSLTRLQQKKL